MKGEKFTKSAKKSLFKTAGYKCQHCSEFLPNALGGRNRVCLEVHHYMHFAQGGSADKSNGVVLCTSCHTAVHKGEIVSPLPLIK